MPITRALSMDCHLDPWTGKLKKYLVIAGPGMDDYANQLESMDKDRFVYKPSKWNKFADDTDQIVLGGFSPKNEVRGSHILFLATFNNNDVTLSQYYALVCLAESFIESLTILLPFFPTATMERVLVEGEVATANALAKMFSNLPSIGRPARLMLYDLHTLQNRFYFGNNTLATLHTAFPLMLEKIRSMPDDEKITAVVFPDDGAEKRFKHMFTEEFPDMEVIVCGKKRDPDDPDVRKIVIKDGQPQDKHCLVIDDLVQTGGTLYETAKKLSEEGAAAVSAFVTHSVFPKESWKRFLKTGDRACFKYFFTTDSNPTIVAQIPKGDVFEVLSLIPQVYKDL
eukprot:gb/GFBE01024885.1/.p1 GENE.gb/GFBE01024885.1/~~gb/GFBE01024885.1/.p1  ORF type:complete len:340 (+),score=77.17 gb/GFBE01024885.1/:1-1020(+)